MRVFLMFQFKDGSIQGLCMVYWLACLIFTAAIGVQIPVMAVKFHNVYDYTIERHPWHIGKHKLTWRMRYST